MLLIRECVLSAKMRLSVPRLTFKPNEICPAVLHEDELAISLRAGFWCDCRMIGVLFIY